MYGRQVEAVLLACLLVAGIVLATIAVCAIS